MDRQVDSTDALPPGNSALAMCDDFDGLNLLLSCVQDYALCMLDLEGRVTTWNISAERIYGYDGATVVGCHHSLFFTPEDIADNLPDIEIAAVRADGQKATEGWRLRNDGSRFCAHVVTAEILDNNGKPRGFAQVTRDISTRKQMDERFRLVVESAPNAMVMISSSGTIEMVNAQAERLFGYSRAEMLGERIEMLVPERFRHHHPAMRNSFFSDPRSRPMGAGRDLFGRRKDGSEFAVEIGLNPIETEQGSMVLSAIVDISDRKQKEENIQNALKEKDVLLGEIHHRVKNNLQIIHSLLDLQCNNIEDPAVSQMLKDSQNRIRSMAVIHQTLYQSNDFAAVDLSNVIGLITSSLLTSFGVLDGRIALTISAKEMPLSINKAIPCGLIINELVTNALKHAFPYPIAGVIAITLEEVAGEVTLTVEDNGVGISEAVNVALSATLGLQLVNLLAEQIGGKLTLNRVAPTRFTLRFPL